MESAEGDANDDEPRLCQSCLIFVRMRFLGLSHFGRASRLRSRASVLHGSRIVYLFILQSAQNFGNAFKFGHLFILQFGEVSERLVVNLGLGFILGLSLGLAA